MESIYIVTETYEDLRHYSTVFSSYEEALERVKYTLKGFTSWEYKDNRKWYAYFMHESAIRTIITKAILIIEQFNYLPGHDEWVNVN